MNPIAGSLQPTPRDQAGVDGIQGTSSILYRPYQPSCPTYRNSDLKHHLQVHQATSTTAPLTQIHPLQSPCHLRRSTSHPRTSLVSFVSIAVELPSMTRNSSSSLILCASHRHSTYPIWCNAHGGREWERTQPQNQKTLLLHS